MIRSLAALPMMMPTKYPSTLPQLELSCDLVSSSAIVSNIAAYFLGLFSLGLFLLLPVPADLSATVIMPHIMGTSRPSIPIADSPSYFGG